MSASVDGTTAWCHDPARHPALGDQTDTVSLYVDAGTASGIRLRENDELAPRRPSSPKTNCRCSAPAAARRTSRTSSPGIRCASVPVSRSPSAPTSTRSPPATGGAGPPSGTSGWSSGPAALARSPCTSPTPAAPSSASTAYSRRRHHLGFELSLKPFGDGGWYWFDLAASRTSWCSRAASGRPAGDRPPRARSLSRSPP